MAMSVSMQSYCTKEYTHPTEENSHELNYTTHTHFLTLFGSISPAPSGEVPLQSRQWKTAGYRAIWDWVGFLQSCEWGDGGLWKGIPLEPSLSHTHTCLLGIPLHFQALLCLESGGSKEVHSSPRSEWSHNTQPTGVYDPFPVLEDYIVAIRKSTETGPTYPNAEALFSLSSHLLISKVSLVLLWNPKLSGT